jgi:hypothetical protein|nr:hypothetical protein [Planctomicrobium sp.]
MSGKLIQTPGVRWGVEKSARVHKPVFVNLMLLSIMFVFFAPAKMISSQV